MNTDDYVYYFNPQYSKGILMLSKSDKVEIDKKVLLDIDDKLKYRHDTYQIIKNEDLIEGFIGHPSIEPETLVFSNINNMNLFKLKYGI